MDTKVAELDVLPPAKKPRKSKKAKKGGAGTKRAKRGPLRSLLAGGRTATTGLVLGAGLAIGAVVGATLGRRR